MQAADGVITVEDLANYRVRWLQPITTTFRDYEFYLMPPPSSGGAVIKTAFELFDHVGIDQYKPLSADEMHLMAEVMNRAFRGRA